MRTFLPFFPFWKERVNRFIGDIYNQFDCRDQPGIFKTFGGKAGSVKIPAVAVIKNLKGKLIPEEFSDFFYWDSPEQFLGAYGAVPL